MIAKDKKRFDLVKNAAKCRGHRTFRHDTLWLCSLVEKGESPTTEQRLILVVRRLLGSQECDRITDTNKLECGWCREVYEGGYGTWHKSESCHGQIARTTLAEIEKGS